MEIDNESLKEIAWRLRDIRADLMSGWYKLDEWSTPIVNLDSAIKLVDKITAKSEKPND